MPSFRDYKSYRGVGHVPNLNRIKTANNNVDRFFIKALVWGQTSPVLQEVNRKITSVNVLAKSVKTSLPC